jgi:hypothetical protein
VVSIDTESLPITQKTLEGTVHIESSASVEPVPVRVRVVALPSPLNRYLLRPLAGALVAGLPGAAIGWTVGRWALEAPGVISRWAAEPVAPTLFWTVAVGLGWAALGWYRGLKQPAAWLTLYAGGRWLLRALAWAMGLCLLALVGHWSWGHLGPELGGSLPAPSVGAVLLVALAIAALPAVIGEVRSTRPRRQPPAISPGRLRFPLRPLKLAGLGITVLLLLVFLVPVAARAWQQWDLERSWSSARRSAIEAWTELEAGISELLDSLSVRLLERAEPEATPYPTRVPARTPAGQGSSP